MNTKQTEALKLALEAMTYADACLKKQLTTKDKHQYAQDLLLEAGTAIREALAEQPAQVDPCPGCLKGRVCRTPKCGRLKLPADHPLRSEQPEQQPAQQQEPCQCPECQVTPHASDCAVHNEPAYPNGVCSCKAQPEQEPVAWMDGYRNIYSLEEKAAGCPEANIALVPMANHKKTSGSPINELQCVCGAVWLGEEMVHLPEKRQPASKPWVGLVWGELPEDGHNHDFLRGAAWAESKLREKNA